MSKIKFNFGNITSKDGTTVFPTDNKTTEELSNKIGKSNGQKYYITYETETSSLDDHYIFVGLLKEFKLQGNTFKTPYSLNNSFNLIDDDHLNYDGENVGFMQEINTLTFPIVSTVKNQKLNDLKNVEITTNITIEDILNDLETGIEINNVKSKFNIKSFDDAKDESQINLFRQGAGIYTYKNILKSIWKL